MGTSQVLLPPVPDLVAKLLQEQEVDLGVGQLVMGDSSLKEAVSSCPSEIENVFAASSSPLLPAFFLV